MAGPVPRAPAPAPRLLSVLAVPSAPPPAAPPYPAPTPTASAYPAPAPAGRGERPLGVTILAVLWGLMGLAAAGFGVLALGAGSIAAAGLFWVPFFGLAGAFFAFFGLMMVAFGLVVLAMAYGFLQGLPWAWTVALVLTLLSLVMAVANMLQDAAGGIVSFLLALLFLWYYSRPGVQRWFGKEGAWPQPQIDGLLAGTRR